VIGTLNAVELAASARQRKNAASWILLVAGLVIMTLGAGLYFTADAFINLVSTQQREVDQRPGAGGIAQPTPRMAKDNMVGRLSTVALGIVTVGLIIAVAGLLKHGTASKRKNPNYKTGPA
jgi:hypothetical protein